jgi:hypothetical protein
MSSITITVLVVIGGYFLGQSAGALDQDRS